MMAIDRIAELGSVLDNEDVTALFQPIINIDSNSIHGFEALSRGPIGSSVHSPFHLFSAAERLGRLSELETLCRRVSIAQFQQKQLPGKLFINISPKALLDPTHPKGQTLKLLQQFGIAPSNVVIELSEQYPADDIDQLKACLNHYRNQGFLTALDDLGAGYSGLRLWSELSPDYVKIDRHFIHHIDKFPVKQEFVRSIIELCQSLTCKVIAEGIETEAELTILRQLGITYCQGFLLGRPEAQPDRQLQTRYLTIRQQEQPRYNEAAESLCHQAQTCPSETELKQLSERFLSQPELQCIVVLEQKHPLGLVYRHRLMELFSRPYGRALHEHQAVIELMDRDVLMVDAATPLSLVSQKLTAKPGSEIAQEFIILRQGEFIGLGHTRELLQRITEHRIQMARHANPLTELPGNVPIQEELQRLRKLRQHFYLAYFDLCHFKPYNDIYGFSRGDEVIRAVAGLLRQYGKAQFIGHVGGDDFVMIGTEPKLLGVCQQILAEFEQSKRQFFSDEHWQRQRLFAKDRQEQECFQPLLRLSVGILPPPLSLDANEHELSRLCALAKKQAKHTPQGLCLLDMPKTA
ncbi:bifunctional diguanylate cyclase/phosphodiesterase [Shewanella indica]|uniref:bifunctional diguanylate cyclase/phosphodiesterase n=1 Tax=Shewanella indica TaxID=768528 RepID=UPI00399A5633